MGVSASGHTNPEESGIILSKPAKPMEEASGNSLFMASIVLVTSIMVLSMVGGSIAALGSHDAGSARQSAISAMADNGGGSPGSVSAKIGGSGRNSGDAGKGNGGVSPFASGTGYKLRISEAGLPSGTQWKVLVNGHAYSGTAGSGSINVPVSNGTYTISPQNLSYYYASSYNGTVRINGSSSATKVGFSHYSYIKVEDYRGGGATLTLNGQVEKFPSGYRNITVTSGNYSLEISEKGYKTFYDNFSISSGQVKSIGTTLYPVKPSQGLPPGEIYTIFLSIFGIGVAITLVMVIRSGK